MRTKEIIRHDYAGASFTIIATDPSENPRSGKNMVDVHIRYESVIGVFVVRIILKKDFIKKTPTWKDYCCQITLEKFHEQKSKRIHRLTKVN